MRSAAALIIGDEILSGEVTDENAPFLLETLRGAGVKVRRVVTAPDELDIIVVELARLRSVADVVVISGGVGPTHDDVTRPAVAEALGVPLEMHPGALSRVDRIYRGHATEAEQAMASLPRGAEILDGKRTGTFGFRVAGVYAFPGVPVLFRDLARDLPEEIGTQPLATCEIISERREGEIAPALADIQRHSLDVAIGSYPVYEDGRWHVRIVLRAEDASRLEAVAAEVRGHVR